MNLPYMVNRIEIAFWTTLVSVLQDRRSAMRAKYILLAVFTAVVLLLALLWARLPSRPAISSAPDLAQAAPLERPANGQSNLLMILVDRLDSRQPRLMSVWLVGRLPTLPQVAFTPIYPARPASAPAATTAIPDTTAADLSPLFVSDVTGGLPRDFVAALRQNGLWWDHYLILDQPALARLVDRLGGVGVDGVWQDGRKINALTPASFDPQTAWSFHLQVVQQICSQVTRMSRKAAAETTAEFAGLVQSDLPADRLETLLRGLQAGGSVCIFPTATGGN